MTQSIVLNSKNKNHHFAKITKNSKLVNDVLSYAKDDIKSSINLEVQKRYNDDSEDKRRTDISILEETEIAGLEFILETLDTLEVQVFAENNNLKIILSITIDEQKSQTIIEKFTSPEYIQAQKIKDTYDLKQSTLWAVESIIKADNAEDATNIVNPYKAWTKIKKRISSRKTIESSYRKIKNLYARKSR